MVRAGEHVGQDLAQLPGRTAVAPGKAEAHVGPAPGQGEGPGVAGEQVGLEPDPEAAAVALHAAHVLAEGVPLAQVARPPGAVAAVVAAASVGRAQGLAQG